MSHQGRYQRRPLACAVACLFILPFSYAETGSTAQGTGESAELDEVVVIGNRKGIRDAVGQGKVYWENMSSVYRGKEEVERFKGAAPADVFKGMVGVNSGDARNSGALDPNVRGIQGQGRVPLTVDGTEQSITVWRGYSGANNRNYIDPMLIGGLTVEKGAGLTRGIKSSVGGAVAVTTLTIDDVVLPNRDWGVDIKMEGSNNSTKARLPNLQQGMPDSMKGMFENNSSMQSFYDHATLVNPKSNGQNKFGQDQAFRIAAGKKWADFDVLGAYVYRQKGNHFSGKRGSGRYSGDDYDKDRIDWDQYTKHLAEVYKPGDEVTNTSNETQSILLKGTWRPTNHQSLQLGLRHTWAEYGKIMPSRLPAHLAEYNDLLETGSPEVVEYLEKYMLGKFPQWPLSKVKTTAVNLTHKWRPENPYIDLDTNLWATRNTLDTHTAGGYPREFYNNLPKVPQELHGQYRNTSLTNSKNKRWGLTTSNKMDLASNLSLTIGGSYQHETIDSKDNWYLDPLEQLVASEFSFRSIPREGWRKEWDLNFNFDWQPTSWLEVSAGARKNGFSSYDEQLNKQRKARNEKYATQNRRYIDMDYEVDVPKELNEGTSKYNTMIDAVLKDSSLTLREKMLKARELGSEQTKWENEYVAYLKQDYNAKGIDPKIEYTRGTWIASGTHRIDADGDDKFNRKDNPFLNGEFESQGIKPASSHYYRVGRQSAADNPDRFKEVPKQSNSGSWQPVLAATAWFTDNARVYARYAKTQRMPSMFESTVGFSTSNIILSDLKPEKGTNIEIGYVHDLSELLKADRYADVKLAWFKNDIKDVIDRDGNFNLSNLDKQKIEGLELQSRYDNGRFFADLSASYFIKNQVCDHSSAMVLDPVHGRVSDCINDGFYNSYLRNMTPPKYAVNLTLGGRFMNERLEIGTRILHHAGSKNTDEENFGDIKKHAGNVPIHWKSATTVDAWLNYSFKKDLTVELVGTNLTNQYYLDPLTRTHFPAPGRTIRLGINKKF